MGWAHATSMMSDVGQQIAVADCFDGNIHSALGSTVCMALQDLLFCQYCPHGRES